MSAPLVVVERSRILVYRNTITSGKQVGAPLALATPGGLAMTDDATLVVVEQAAGRVAVLDLLGGGWTTSFGPGAGPDQLDRPSDIAVDGKGRWVIADRGNRRIVRVEPDGSDWQHFGTPGTGVGQFVDPLTIAVDGNDRIVVADPGANRVVRLDDIDGSGWSTVATPPPPDPALSALVTGVAADGDQWAVADVGARTVYLFDLADAILGTTGLEPTMLVPTYVDLAGNSVVLADPALNEVRRFRLEAGRLMPELWLRGSDPSLPAPAFEQLAGVSGGF